MAKVITSKEGNKYYSPVTYTQFCLNSNSETLDSFIQDEIHDIIDRVYPIGAYYISATATSPADLFNYGTWELLESGKTILGAGAAYDISTWETKTLADGSKWAKIYYQDANTAWTQVEETNKIYDRLDQLNKFYSHETGDSGCLEFLMEHESLGLNARWKQRAYPLSWNASLGVEDDMILQRSNYTATSVNEGCYLPESMTYANYFFGLGLSDSTYSKISGCPGYGSFRFGLRVTAYDTATAGTTYLYCGTAGYETISRTLWVRYDNVIAWGVEAGTTGGNSTITLTVSQIPSHRHGIGRASGKVSRGGIDDHGRGSTIGGQVTTSKGSGSAHNNLQPYTNVFVWKRIEDSAIDTVENIETIEGLEV